MRITFAAIVWAAPVDLQGNPVERPGALTEANPAAITAQGCAATTSELAVRYAGSEAPCLPGAPATPVVTPE